MRGRTTLFWQRRGAEACAEGYDREQLIAALIDLGHAPETNEHKAALRGWDERNAAEARAACRAVIVGPFPPEGLAFTQARNLAGEEDT